MNIQPKVSIIIPSYNNLEQLKNCLESIENQSYTNFEVWIVDGGSTDGTKDYLSSLNPPFHFISEKDSGIYNAMNKGIEKSKGEWLCFLGSDDRFYDTSVLEKLFATENHEEVQMLIGNIEYSNGLKFQSKFSSKLWYKNTVHHQSVFYKRELFDKIRYNENYKVLADYHLNLQLLKQQVAYKKIDTVIAVCGEEGISKNYNWNLYIEEIHLKTSLTSVFMKPLFYILGISKYIFRKLF